MRKMKLLWHFLKLHPNVWKTIRLNFTVFKLRDAVRFPVLLFGSVRLEGIRRGCIKLTSIELGGGKDWRRLAYGDVWLCSTVQKSVES